MHATLESQLTRFNAMAMRYQDDAYTFAYYLLGDDGCAARVTGTAFARVSRQRKLEPANFRADILRMVLESCHAERIPVSGSRVVGDLTGKLQHLSFDERSAVVLVDVLGCSYDEAASVLDCSTRQVMRLLTRGRLSLGRASLPM
jgi:DNA-directed RNA polymerase specialized sigma24 family protein